MDIYPWICFPVDGRGWMDLVDGWLVDRLSPWMLVDPIKKKIEDILNVLFEANIACYNCVPNFRWVISKNGTIKKFEAISNVKVFGGSLHLCIFRKSERLNFFLSQNWCDKKI